MKSNKTNKYTKTKQGWVCGSLASDVLALLRSAVSVVAIPVSEVASPWHLCKAASEVSTLGRKNFFHNAR